MDWVKERNESVLRHSAIPNRRKTTGEYRNPDSKDKIPAIHQIGSTETSNVSKVSPRKA